MLELKNISHYYRNQSRNTEISVFENFNLLIGEGEIVSLVGKSGCGKTTLVNIIAGYTEPTSGSVFMNGEKVVAPGKDRIVINQIHDLFDWMTVYQNMRLVSNDDNDINKYLSMTRLSEFADAYPYELSGGMKKRLSLARALVVDPKFIIMDEPFNSLDYQLREKFQEELLDIVRKSKKTILFVTHDIEEAVFLSDKVIILSGRPTQIKKEIVISFSKNKVDSIRDTEDFIFLKKKIKEEM
ncbi:MAG: hypothetical protein A2589_00990 [Candidatus Vogelbacteria bacterium RIFOXYD1_FULL_46_19]|uniref:ABC transporter domain-containing protein n=1 Tax=Candidatus Vogelbacteria bacterium RIFOXYD1_FULL_46_19 TaxID=1802439 RepID=A0A1G2QHG8_9BACT|nr:MAG: hypothetical protein A2589_00990 [Candidatus Vogelbacteria bacterium RIFOXYD1_FULL_46_19]